MADIPTYEIAQGNRANVNWQNLGQTTRQFVVETNSTATALTADALPKRNDPHPNFPGYFVDNIDVSPNSTGFCDAVITYTNNRSGTIRTVNKDDPAWYLWGWDQQKFIFEIPVNRRETFAFPTDDGGEIVKQAWVLDYFKIEQTMVIRPLRLRLFNVQSVLSMDVISEQTDRLHLMPNGRYYRFLGGDVSQVDETTFEVEYRWLFDPGTRIPGVQNNSDAALFIAPDGATPGFVRDPYTSIVAKGNPDPENMPHESVLVKPYMVDANGWISLPGVQRVL